MHVLQIEDDDATARAVEKVLESKGFTCETVRMGRDAIALATEQHFDLILLDIMLPDIDGYEILQQLRANEVETPIVIQSALIGRNDLDLGAGFGVRDYLVKPFSGTELKDCVAAVLDRQPAAERKPATNGETAADRRKADRSDQILRRRHKRVKTLKSAQIIYKNSNCVLDCLVVNMSEGGAALTITRLEELPDTFLLKLQHGATYRCYVCWRHKNKIGVMFLHSSG